MKITQLGAYGIPASVLKSWENYQGENLLPLQAEAVKNYGLLENKSILLSSPTSSGKTFCGEMAAVKHLAKGGKVIYLVPLKAVAEEKYREFGVKYARLGIRIIISTSDHPESDLDLERTNFHLAILVYEKFNQLLVKRLSVLGNISLLIIDELQLLFDSSRGRILELALMKLRSYPSPIQILGLSSVLDQAKDLANWLECATLVQRQRPVELSQGILWRGKFRYKEHNSQKEGVEELTWLEESGAEETLFANLEKMLGQKEPASTRGEQVLVFLKSKAQVERLALLLAERIKAGEAAGVVRQLSDLEPTSTREKLLQTLKSGVAFHSADLTYAERGIVEQGYLREEIRVIFCTTTLSLGVNLPAQTVFLEPVKFQNGAHGQNGLSAMSSRPNGILLPLEWAEYENICGRAGRLGLKDSGRAIIIANSEFEAEALWENFIENRAASQKGQLFNSGMEEIILDCVAARGQASLTDLESYLKDSLSYRLKPIEFALPAALEGLSDKHLLTKGLGEKFTATNLGKVAAVQNLSVASLTYLDRQLENFSPRSLGEAGRADDYFSTFFTLLACDETKPFYPYLSQSEKKKRIYEGQLPQMTSSGNILSADLKELHDWPERITPEVIRRLKASFLLCDWMEGIPTRELEEKYQVRAGQIQQLAEQISWLVSSSALIAGFKLPRRHSFLSTLSSRVKFGVTEEGIYLAGLRIPGLGRSFISELVKRSLSERQAIISAGLDELKRFLPEKLAQELFEKLKTSQTDEKSSQVDPSPDKILLEIEARPVKNRFTIRVNGSIVTLAAKSFKYLAKLSCALWTKPEGWIHKEELEPGFNQPRFIHRLKKELCSLFPAGFILIENNRLGSYRLNLKREQVKVNWENLGKVEDEEIKKLLEDKANLTPALQGEPSG